MYYVLFLILPVFSSTGGPNQEEIIDKLLQRFSTINVNKKMREFGARDYLQRFHNLVNKKSNIRERIPFEGVAFTLSDIKTTIETHKNKSRRRFEQNPQNTISLAEAKMRYDIREVDNIIDNNVTSVLEILSKDDLDIITRRFDGLVSYRRQTQLKKSKLRGAPHEYLNITEYLARDVYTPSDFQDTVKFGDHQRKFRFLRIMRQLIYMVRYKLPYVQNMRKMYLDKKSFRYKLGFCFALLQNLIREQMAIYRTMRAYVLNMSNLMVFYKWYEKVVKLSVDVDDVERLIRKLDRKRKLDDDPRAYDYASDDIEASSEEEEERNN